jgi:hypothetical protein
MEGKKYNKLTVICREPNDRHGNPMWRVKCECGKIKVCAGTKIKSGHTKSCGCLSVSMLIARSTKHGQASRTKQSRSYKAWKEMNRRVKRDPTYTSKGIHICDEWAQSYMQFYSDMGDCPAKYELDRVDNAKGYYPQNCRWVSETEQSRNRTYCKLTMDKARSIRQDTRPYKQIAEAHNVSVGSVGRIKNNHAWKEKEKPNEIHRGD